MGWLPAVPTLGRNWGCSLAQASPRPFHICPQWTVFWGTPQAYQAASLERGNRVTWLGLSCPLTGWTWCP